MGGSLVEIIPGREGGGGRVVLWKLFLGRRWGGGGGGGGGDGGMRLIEREVSEWVSESVFGHGEGGMEGDRMK